MASFYLLEDDTGKLLLEDGSGLLIEESEVSLAATEGSDIAAFAAERDVAGSFALAATEGSDTAALTSTVNARLQVTEAGDDASARVNVNASLSATEGSDIVAFRVNVNASLAANEGSDSFAASVNATASLAVTESSDTASLVATDNARIAVTEGSDAADFALQRSGSFALDATEGSDTASFAMSVQEEQTAGRRPKRSAWLKPIVDASAILVGVAGRSVSATVSAFGEETHVNAEAVPSSSFGIARLGRLALVDGEVHPDVVVAGVSGKSAVGSLDTVVDVDAPARVDPSLDCEVNTTFRNVGRVHTGRILTKGVKNPTEQELLVMIAAVTNRGRTNSVRIR